MPNPLNTKNRDKLSKVGDIRAFNVPGVGADKIYTAPDGSKWLRSGYVSTDIGGISPSLLTTAYPYTPTFLLHMDGTNGGTTFTDVYGATVTPTNATTSTTQVKFGSASGYFNGTNAYLTVSTTSVFGFGTADFRVACWVYPVSTGVTRYLFSGATNSVAFGIVNDGSVSISLAGVGTAFTTSAGAVANGAWQYLEISRVSGVTRVFVNGVVPTGGSGADTYNYASNATLIGQNNIGSQWYSGYIDELSVLKGSGITSNYNPPAFPFGTSAVGLPITAYADPDKTIYQYMRIR